MPRARTRSRELALQFLYSVDGRAPEPGELDEFVRAATGNERVVAFARSLAEGCIAHRDALDEAIERAAGRELRAMAVVDRNILRLAAYELLFGEDAPVPVVLTEAIELAGRFSTARSGAFVHGVLDRIRRDRDRSRETPEDGPCSNA